ncbi:MAG TPA: helix-turn-helix domain-containing protein [Candidatus Paceibacterota bacterium]|nr:helix-turn-helix domain-containing protein [Candidatus Paceibacterota bacterium]
MDELDFPSFFNEKIKGRGLSLRKLAELSGITERHLEALSRGDYANMPAAPYLRGYLTTLGRILDFDAGFWWDHFKTNNLMPSSGRTDQLPKNRFAPRRAGPAIAIGCAALAVLLYFLFRFPQIFGQPLLRIEAPAAATSRVAESSITVRGRIESGDEVAVNGESVPVASDGTWQKEFFLQPGLNTIEVVGKKFLGRETRMVRQVIYEPPVPAPLQAATSTPAPAPTP